MKGVVALLILLGVVPSPGPAHIHAGNINFGNLNARSAVNIIGSDPFRHHRSPPGYSISVRYMDCARRSSAIEADIPRSGFFFISMFMARQYLVDQITAVDFRSSIRTA